MKGARCVEVKGVRCEVVPGEVGVGGAVQGDHDGGQAQVGGVPGVGCMVHCAWCKVHGAWCMVHGEWWEGGYLSSWASLASLLDLTLHRRVRTGDR